MPTTASPIIDIFCHIFPERYFQELVGRNKRSALRRSISSTLAEAARC